MTKQTEHLQTSWLIIYSKKMWGSNKSTYFWKKMQKKTCWKKNICPAIIDKNNAVSVCMYFYCNNFRSIPMASIEINMGIAQFVFRCSTKQRIDRIWTMWSMNGQWSEMVFGHEFVISKISGWKLIFCAF